MAALRRRLAARLRLRVLDRLRRVRQNLLASQADVPQLVVAERQQRTPMLRPFHREQKAAPEPPDEIADPPAEAFAGFCLLHWKFVKRAHGIFLPRQLRPPVVAPPVGRSNRWRKEGKAVICE